MGLKGLLVVVLVVVLLYDEVLAKSKSSRVWSSSRGGNVKPFSRSKPKYHHSSRSSMFSRRSGLSNSRKKALFFTAGALAGIYIGSRMRSAVHLRSYHDLYKYEVCEGRRTEYINATGMTRTYTYFLCPDDPNQPFERYCCWDTSTGMGVCCSYDVKVSSTSGRGAIVGALFGILFLGLVIGIFFYCCCRRKRQSVVMEPVDIPTGQPIPPVDPFYKPNQYPGMYPTQPVPSYPGYPYPPAGQGVVYIQNGSTPYPPAQPVTPTPGPTQIGSGWGGTADVNLSNQAARPNYPPPPYPGYPSSSPPPITDDPTVNPSAPSSAFMTKS